MSNEPLPKDTAGPKLASTPKIRGGEVTARRTNINNLSTSQARPGRRLERLESRRLDQASAGGSYISRAGPARCGRAPHARVGFSPEKTAEFGMLGSLLFGSTTKRDGLQLLPVGTEMPWIVIFRHHAHKS